MDTLSFFRKILPSSGWYCCARRKFKNGQDAGWLNEPYATLEELTARVLEVSGNGGNVWMALASYKEKASFNPDNNATYFRRTQANANFLKTLWADIDVREDDRHYKTIVEAQAALVSFLDSTGLPAPLVVNSGYGLHCYWPLSKDYPAATIKQYAELLKKLMLSHGLKIDASVAADTARVLRPVGANNYKGENPREVRVVFSGSEYTDEELFAVLTRAPAASSFETIVSLTAPDSANDYPLLPSFSDSAPKQAPLIIKECRQVREAPGKEEPVWRGMLSILKLCENGEEWCHEMSKLDERYDQDVTEKKLATIGATPYLCSTFDAMCPGVCTGCKHFGAISSPISLGVERPTSVEVKQEVKGEVVDNKTLNGSEFFFSSAVATPRAIVDPLTHRKFEIVLPHQATPEKPVGVIYIKTEKIKVDGVEQWQTTKEYICSQVPVPVAITYERDALGNKQQFYWVDVYDKDTCDTAMIPGENFHSQQDVISALGTAGVNVVDSSHYPIATTYMRAYIAQVKQASPEFEAHEHLGWNGESFLLGKRAFKLEKVGEDGWMLAETQAHLARRIGQSSIIKSVDQKGDLEKWKQAFNVFAAPGLEHFAFGALTAFGAPLQKFTAHRGLLINLYNPSSGQGKSACQKVAASVWGPPDKFMMHNIGSGSGDTFTAMMTTIVQLHSLPAIMEEITELPSEKIVATLSTLEGGNERRRGKSDGGIQSSGDWYTLMLSSSNSSMREKIAQAKKADGSPSLSRVIEVDVPDLNTDVGGEDWIKTKEILDLSNDNYGVAGVEFTKALVLNQHRFKDMLAKEYKRLAKIIGGTQVERFWLSALAAIFVGGRLAKVAGLHSYDMERIEAYVLSKVVPKNRTAVVEGRVNTGSLLGDILASMSPGTVAITKSSITSTDDAPLMAPCTVLKLPSIGASVKVRYDAHRGWAYISRVALREWSKQNMISMDEITKAFKKNKVLVKEHSRTVLGRGVKELAAMSMSPVDCLVVRTPKNMDELLTTEEIEDGE